MARSSVPFGSWRGKLDSVIVNSTEIDQWCLQSHLLSKQCHTAVHSSVDLLFPHLLPLVASTVSWDELQLMHCRLVHMQVAHPVSRKQQEDNVTIVSTAHLQ